MTPQIQDVARPGREVVEIIDAIALLVHHRVEPGTEIDIVGAVSGVCRVVASLAVDVIVFRGGVRGIDDKDIVAFATTQAIAPDVAVGTVGQDDHIVTAATVEIVVVGVSITSNGESDPVGAIPAEEVIVIHALIAAGAILGVNGHGQGVVASLSVEVVVADVGVAIVGPHLGMSRETAP